MFYSVKYRKPGQLFFRTLKNIKADGLIEGSARARFIILQDETRIELPCECEFVFSKERFLAIKETMEAQSGQPIKTV